MKHTRVFRDANHLDIVKELKKRGCTVVDLAAVGQSVPDIIVANRHGVTALIEIKLPTGRFYLSQLRFLATWNGLCGFAETTEDVTNILDLPNVYGLDVKDRQTILQIIAEDLADVGRRGKASLGKEQITVKKFEKLFAEKMSAKA